MDILGGILVMTLFMGYLFLWKFKRLTQIKISNIDPEVMDKSRSNLQRYMGRMFKVLTGYTVFLVIFHTLNIKFFSLFTRFSPLGDIYFRCLGFFIGIIGLSFCLYAQLKMGKSWRVGIDEDIRTDLITTGLYKVIRNPTYLGLFILNLGVWIIWPTWTVFFFNVLFIYSLEIQVRCEEDFLEEVHGNVYLRYKKNTKRYLPFIY